MKKLCALFMALILVLSLAACSSSDIDKLVDKITDSTDTAKDGDGEKITEAVTPVATTTPEPTKEATTPTPTETVEPTAAPTEEPTPTEEVVSTAIEGPEVKTLPNMDDVYEAYYNYVRDCMDEEYTYFDTMRFGLAYIDDDELPELLVADADYHGCGVKVIFYNNGEPKQVGEFGEFGGFAYHKKENSIISFYMGMGVIQTAKLHVDKDLNAVTDTLLYYTDMNSTCTINDVEVDRETYDKASDEISISPTGKSALIVEYEDMLPYYPYVCYPELIDAFEKMNEELKSPEYEKFSGYSNEQMEQLYGAWSLIKAFVAVDDYNIDYDMSSVSEDGFEVYSEATVSKENGLGLWVSTYKDGEMINSASPSEYAMKLIYYPTGIAEGVDYGWCVEGYQPYFVDYNWKYYACTDDEDHLIVYVSRELEGQTDEYGYPLSDFLVLTYERTFNEQDYANVYATVNRAADKDIAGKYAYTADEYIWIHPDDADLIKQYGLPEDLNGYDYEIVDAGDDPFVFYVDENTYIEILDFDSFKRRTITADELPAMDKYDTGFVGEYMICFDGVNEKGNYEGMTAAGLIFDYTG